MAALGRHLLPLSDPYSKSLYPPFLISEAVYDSALTCEHLWKLHPVLKSHFRADSKVLRDVTFRPGELISTWLDFQGHTPALSKL